VDAVGTDPLTPKGWMLSKANKLRDYHRYTMDVCSCSGTRIWLYNGFPTGWAFVLKLRVKYYHLLREGVETYELLAVR
jgi:hypothetical protein